MSAGVHIYLLPLLISIVAAFEIAACLVLCPDPVCLDVILLMFVLRT